MPRRLLRDGQVVADDWRYPAEMPDADASLILTFDDWFADKDRWVAHSGRLGVLLQAAHKVELLAPDLWRFALVGAEFPGPGEGRGYTQGRVLRERHGFDGELRATGYVRRDQLFFLARCGFNSFELPDGEIEDAAAAFLTFSAEYQPANDRGLTRKLRRRSPPAH